MKLSLNGTIAEDIFKRKPHLFRINRNKMPILFVIFLCFISRHVWATSSIPISSLNLSYVSDPETSLGVDYARALYYWPDGTDFEVDAISSLKAVSTSSNSVSVFGSQSYPSGVTGNASISAGGTKANYDLVAKVLASGPTNCQSIYIKYSPYAEKVASTYVITPNLPVSITVAWDAKYDAADIFCYNSVKVAATITLSDIVLVPSAATEFDLSVSQISLSQPAGTAALLDANGVPTLATTTPANSIPAPAVPPVTAQASVSINLSGSPTGATSTTIQLMLGSQIIATQSVDVRSLAQGNNLISIQFPPPTDPNLLGTLPLTATIDPDHSLPESSFSNNSVTLNIDTMILCKVEDSGKTVPFYVQGGPGVQWSSYILGDAQNSQYVDPTMQEFGCSVTDLAMLFNSYGISHVPKGSPTYPSTTLPFAPPKGLDGGALDPGSLDYAMTNYTTNFITQASVGFDAHNDVNWAGAAEVARAGYRAQCSNSVSSCDPNNAPNVVSYKKQIPAYANEQAAIAGIQNEICSGNPVILKFGKAGGGQHFILATGIVLDTVKNVQTLQLNNPGTKDGKDQFFNDIKSNYPTFIGGSLFHPSADPTMMYFTAPLNVHFVVTDPQGRKTGYDPTTNVTYSDIPGASYEIQSIDTPNEDGYTPKTLVAERYFVSSSDVLVGKYQIDVFGVTSGSYYLDYRAFDATGTTNNSLVQTGTIQTGKKVTLSILHSDEAALVPNAKISVADYSVRRSDRGDDSYDRIIIAGKLTPNLKQKLNPGAGFMLSIGGSGQYSLNIVASNFKTRKVFANTFYEYENKSVKIAIDENGIFGIEIKNANLEQVAQGQIGLLGIVFGDTIAQVNLKVSHDERGCSLDKGHH